MAKPLLDLVFIVFLCYLLLFQLLNTVKAKTTLKIIF